MKIIAVGQTFARWRVSWPGAERMAVGRLSLILRRSPDQSTEPGVKFVGWRIDQRRHGDDARRRVLTAENNDAFAGRIERGIVRVPQVDAEDDARRHH